MIYVDFTGEPLYVGMDLTIASFDSISEVNMVSILYPIKFVCKCQNLIFPEFSLFALKIEINKYLTGLYNNDVPEPILEG